MEQHRRIVVKVGTSTLTHGSGRLHFARLEALARTLTDLNNRGHEVVLVTSGAIAVGVTELHMSQRPTLLAQKQAASAVGQCRLMHVYDKLFAEVGQPVAQILLSREDVDIDTRRASLLGTLDTLFSWNVLPIVNENDSVNSEEIESGHGVFGDNDTLGAAVARLVGAELLVLLTDIDGLYTGDPRRDPSAKRIAQVSRITPELRDGVGDAGTARGTGGMLTKLAAAEMALEHGFTMVIASGASPDILYDIMDGKPVGTWFCKAEGGQ